MKSQLDNFSEHALILPFLYLFLKNPNFKITKVAISVIRKSEHMIIMCPYYLVFSTLSASLIQCVNLNVCGKVTKEAATFHFFQVLV